MAFKEKIDHNTFVLIRWIVLGIFWLVALVFTGIAFTSLGEGWTKIAWIVATLAWEGGTLVVVSMLKTAVVNKGHWFRILTLTLAYLIMASVPFIGSLGFNLANERKQSVVATTKPVDVSANEYEIEQAKKANDLLDSSIAALEKQRDVYLESDQQSKANGKQAEIDKKLKEKEKNTGIVTSKSSANTTATTVTAVSAENLFKEVGTITDGRNWKAEDGSLFRNFIFLVFGLVVILMVALAAPTIEEALVAVRLSAPSIDTRLLQKYIEALFEVTGRRLNKDETITEKTGIDLEKCKEFRAYLMKLTYKGTPGNPNTALFTRDNGGTKANFAKEHVIKIASFYARVGQSEEESAT